MTKERPRRQAKRALDDASDAAPSARERSPSPLPGAASPERGAASPAEEAARCAPAAPRRRRIVAVDGGRQRASSGVASTYGRGRVEPEPSAGVPNTALSSGGLSSGALARAAVPAPAVVARALVVDDDPEIRRALARHLRPELDVHLAGTVAQADAVLERLDRVDVAFIDWELPDGTGEQILERLAHWPDAIRVLISAKVSSSENPLKNRALANLVLGKPLALGVIDSLKRAALALPHDEAPRR